VQSQAGLTRKDLRNGNLQLKMSVWPAVWYRDCLQWKSLEDRLTVWQWTAEELVEEVETTQLDSKWKEIREEKCGGGRKEDWRPAWFIYCSFPLVPLEAWRK
jgi:hypothetical protein